MVITAPDRTDFAEYDRVRPSVEGLLATDLALDPDELVEKAVRANIQTSIDHLHGLLVVGAEYSLDAGVVDFVDEHEGA